MNKIQKASDKIQKISDTVGFAALLVVVLTNNHTLKKVAAAIVLIWALRPFARVFWHHFINQKQK